MDRDETRRAETGGWNDHFQRHLQAAKEHQLRMRGEVLVEQTERYLAKMAPFMQWCRARERAAGGILAPSKEPRCSD